MVCRVIKEQQVQLISVGSLCSRAVSGAVWLTVCTNTVDFHTLARRLLCASELPGQVFVVCLSRPRV